MEAFDSLVWSSLAARIFAGDRDAETELVGKLERGLRFLILHNSGAAYVDDCLQKTLMIVLEAARKGTVENIPAFASTVARRQAYASLGERSQYWKGDEADMRLYFERVTEKRATMLPEGHLELRERARILGEILGKMRKKKPEFVEILTRFYLQEQTPDQICREMGLTATQFRLHKNRARNMLSDEAQKMNQPGIVRKTKIHKAAAEKPSVTVH